jgi:FMN phosphatase YigB (HAD superfamily)
METTTVLLDAGGVILDESEHETVRVEIATEVLATVVPSYSTERLYDDLAEAIERFCPRVLAYVIWKHVGPDKVLFDRLYGDFRSRWRKRKPPLRLTAGFADEVRAIAGHFDAGIAGQYGRELLDLLERHRILEHFSHRLTQDDFAITKPDPRYLEEIARACGVEPQACIMVGDRIDNDIVPARQLGMKAVLVRVGLHRNQRPRIPDEMPDAELPGIDGLARTLVELRRDH